MYQSGKRDRRGLKSSCLLNVSQKSSSFALSNSFSNKVSTTENLCVSIKAGISQFSDVFSEFMLFIQTKLKPEISGSNENIFVKYN